MLGKTKRQQTGKQIKTNAMAEESLNLSGVEPPKKRAVPAFIKGPGLTQAANTSMISDINEVFSAQNISSKKLIEANNLQQEQKYSESAVKRATWAEKQKTDQSDSTQKVNPAQGII